LIGGKHAEVAKWRREQALAEKRARNLSGSRGVWFLFETSLRIRNKSPGSCGLLQ